jgi:hypothetical protein
MHTVSAGETPIPPALRGAFDDFARSEERVRALLLGRSAEQLNWRPEPGRWSMLQCVEHLAVTNRFLGNSIELALKGRPLAGPESDRIAPGLAWRVFLRLLEPSVTLKGFAPRVLQPAPSLDCQRTLAGFVEGHGRLRSLAGRCEGLDLNRLKFRHPIIVMKLSIGTAFLLLAVHERRHIGQAQRVAASPGMPG